MTVCSPFDYNEDMSINPNPPAPPAFTVRVLYNDAIVNRDTDEPVPELRASDAYADPDGPAAAHLDFGVGTFPFARRRTVPPYQPGDPLLEVYRFVVAIDPNENPLVAASHILSDVYTQLNITHPEGWTHRSMSIGDVVVIGEGAWVCASMGWDPVTLTGSDIKDAL